MTARRGLSFAFLVACASDPGEAPAGESSGTSSATPVGESSSSGDGGTTAIGSGGASSGSGTSSTSSSGSSTDGTTAGADSATVLLIGNSYTLWNDLGILLGAASSDTLIATTIAFGGAALTDHAVNPMVTDAIESGEYDFVVVQGQSFEPIADAEGFATAGAQLAALAIDNAAIPVLYQTWAREPGSPHYTEIPALAGHDFDSMHAAIATGYQDLAADTGAVLAPVGEGWAAVIGDGLPLSLYTPDTSHPSLHGSWLAAQILYGAITGLDPDPTAEHPAAITDDEADLIVDVATSVL